MTQLVAEKQFAVTTVFSQEEYEGLTDELEAVFARYAKEGDVHRIPNIIEFKNMLTLAVNNAR